MSQAVIEALGGLVSKYEQLKEVSEKSFNQSGLDLDLLKRANEQILNVLNQGRSYRGNLKLQQMSELDGDVEDENALKTQVYLLGWKMKTL